MSRIGNLDGLGSIAGAGRGSIDNAWNMGPQLQASISVAAQGSYVSGLHFSPDGTRMYILNTDPTSTVYQFTLSTPWLVSSAVVNGSFVVSAQEPAASCVTLSSDGTKMFVLGGKDIVYAYNLSAAWNITSAVYSGVSGSVAAQDAQTWSIVFAPDGLTMYLTGGSNRSVYRYSFSTAWSVSTLAYTGQVSVNAMEPVPKALYASADGTKMLIGGTSNFIHLFMMPAWGGPVYTGQKFPADSWDTDVRAVSMDPTGTQLYFLGGNSKTIYQITL